MLTPKRVARAIIVAGSLLVSTGCANLGFRPDPPAFDESATACGRFADLAAYSQDLQKAYHSRATLNRSFLYVAGMLLLGTVAATGGLGAAGGAGLAIALVSLSGGFASGVFAIMDNSALANVYTNSANQMAEGLAKSEGQLSHKDGAKGYTDASCLKAWSTLNAELTKATTTLETARTNSAAGALIRARGERKALDGLIEELENRQPGDGDTSDDAGDG